MDAEIMGEVTRKMMADADGDTSVLTPAQLAERMQTITSKSEACKYNLTTLPDEILILNPAAPVPTEYPETPKWTARYFAKPPAIGTRVRVNFNSLGTGTVQGYFIEHGWVGVHVLPDQRPAWHLKQNGPEKNYYLVFGLEVAPI